LKQNLVDFYQKLTNSTAKKIAFWSGSFLILLGVFFTVVLTFYQDGIIQAFVNEVNKRLQAEVQPRKITATIWQDFPNVSISFDHILVKEAQVEKPDTLAYFETLYFTFNMWELLDGKYKLQQLYAENGQVNLKIDSKGRNNFTVMKPTESAEQSENFSFKLNRLKLNKVDFSYENFKNKDTYKINISEVVAKVAFQTNSLETELDGACQIRQIRVGNTDYVKNQHLKISMPFSYEFEKEIVQIENTELQLGGGEFALSGLYEGFNDSYLFLKLDGKNTNLQTILAFCPQEVRKELSAYKSRGKVYFNAEIDGKLANNKMPSIQVGFGFSNVSISHPDFSQQIENFFASGEFNNGRLQNLATSTLKLDSLSGNLASNPFVGKVAVSNLADPNLALVFKGNFQLEDLLTFYPIQNISYASGKLKINLDYLGKLSKNSIQQAKGTLDVTNATFQFKNHPKKWQFRTANFQFKRNQIQIDSLAGKVGDSDFLVRGKIVNWLDLGESKYAGLELNLFSNKFAVSDLLSDEISDSEEDSSIFVSPYMNLKAQVNEFVYEDWTMRNAKGEVAISDFADYEFSNFGFDWLEGSFLLNGEMRLKKKENYFAGTIGISSVDLPTLFRTFNDFGLDAISHKNLEGTLSADISAQFPLNKNWDFIWERADAVIDGEVTNGKLINYEPMQQLAVFLKNKDLENISFSKLTNVFLIKADTLIIPKMEIASSAGQIFVGGRQRVSGEMIYHLQVPLKNFKKPDKDEAFGAIEDDGLGGGNLFLLLTGTPDNFKIGYDKQVVAKKIKEDLKDEKKEFLDLFKEKKKKEQVGLKKEEFD
jgi:hypothetical protein